jgi:hypothetical protein
MVACCFPISKGLALFGRDHVVPMTYAIVEHCAERFPEYAAQNKAALDRWRVRNQAFVLEREREDHFKLFLQGAREAMPDLAQKNADFRQFCSELAPALDKDKHSD